MDDHPYWNCSVVFHFHPSHGRVNFLLQIIAANKEAKKAGALLDSDGDTYLKNECKADKWIIVELSQLVRMDTLILAQVTASLLQCFSLPLPLRKQQRCQFLNYSLTLAKILVGQLHIMNFTHGPGSSTMDM